VHDRELIPVVVLRGDLIVAEDLAGRIGAGVVSHPVLIRDVVVVAHDAAVLHVVLEKEMVLRAREPVVHEVLVHFGVQTASVVEIQ
jgi:hypothetical protein